MAKTVRSQVNIDNVIQPPRSSSSLQQQSMFVQPIAPENRRGMQVARALEKATGTLTDSYMKYAQVKQEQISNLDKINASIMGNKHAGTIEEFVKTYDYTPVMFSDGIKRRPTYEMVRDDFFRGHQDIQTEMESFDSVAGQNAINNFIGNTIATNYSASAKAFENNEENVAFNVLAGQELNKLDDIDANSEAFINFMVDMDNNYQALGRTKGESKTFLMGLAETALRDNDDDRLHQYLLGELRDAKGNKIATILDRDQQADFGKRRTAIKAENVRKANAAWTAHKNGIEKRSYQLRSEASVLMQQGFAPDSQEVLKLVDAAVNEGVSGARSIVNGLATDYSTAKNFPTFLSPRQIFDIRSQFESASTQSEQVQILKDNQDILGNHPLVQTLWASVGSLKGYHQAVDYKRTLTNLTEVLDVYGDSENFHKVVNQFSLSFAEYFDSDLYQQHTTQERIIYTDEMLQTASKVVGAPLYEDSGASYIEGGVVKTLDDAQLNLLGEYSIVVNQEVKSINLEALTGIINDLKTERDKAESVGNINLVNFFTAKHNEVDLLRQVREAMNE